MLLLNFENYVAWWSYVVDDLSLIVYNVCTKKVHTKCIGVQCVQFCIAQVIQYAPDAY